MRQILQPIGEKLMPLPAGEQLFELRRGFDSDAEYPVLDLIQNEIDCLQGARGLLGEGDTEIFDFLCLDLDGLLAQIPNRQRGGQ